MDQLLPPFLERNYGEDVPIFLIHSLNMWIGMFGPSLAAALTMHLEAFEVMLPGLWVMALSPAWLAFDPSVEAVCAGLSSSRSAKCSGRRASPRGSRRCVSDGR